MPSPKPDLTRLIEQWRNRLRDAELNVDFAQNYKKEVRQDFPPETASTPDGDFAHYQAVRAENAARLEYERVLRIYRHLILHGKLPCEDDLST